MRDQNADKKRDMERQKGKLTAELRVTKDTQYSEAHRKKWRHFEVEMERSEGRLVVETTLEIPEAKVLRGRKQYSIGKCQMIQYIQEQGKGRSADSEVKG